MGWVDNIRDGGSTNIAQALQTAMGMIADPDRPGYVLFLTDGLPTAGEQNEMKIARLCEQANDHEARLFAFGVGFDVNARLLDRLANANGGVSEYVKPDQDIESAVSRFYGRLSAPVLSDVAVGLESVRINRAYPRDLPDLFDGGQVVYVGRYGKAGSTELTVRGRIDGHKKTFSFPVDLAEKGKGQRYDFVETLWAQRRVGDLIDQIDLHGRSDELMRELVELSSRYGILTPYTSYLADETVALGATMENVRRTERQSLALGEVSGRSGTMQRAYKQSLKSAPTASAQPQSAPLEAADAAIAARASNAIAYDTEGNARVARSVRNLANRAFYRKGDQWIDASLTEAQQKQPVEVRQFSRDYFELSRQLSPAENQLLTFEEDLLVNIRGQAYRIVAAGD
jgi:Ca-activated chloride channel family protein